MPVTYASDDQVLNDSVVFRFTRDNLAGSGAAPSDRIKFQFPPRITGDGRSGNWKESDLPGTEPIAVFETSGPRQISMKWSYIVDGAKWTTTTISEQVRRLRGYFALARDKKGERNLIIEFKMWLHGGDKSMTARIRGIDVKHSDSIIVPNLNPQLAYPLRTDITVDLRLWTMGGTKEKPQNINGLAPTEEIKWF